MKTCSTCGNSFSDDLSFCLQDGTVLKSRVTADLTSQPTEIFTGTTKRDADISNSPTIVDPPTAILPPPVSAPQKVFQMKALEPSSRMGCVLSIGQVAAALVVVIGLGVAGLMFLNTKNEVAMMSANSSANRPMTNTSYANSAMNSTTTASNVPHPAATGSAPKSISAGDVTSQAIELPKPTYPPLARQSDVEGSVEVQVLIDESGRVISATATSGHVLLRAPAENAARSAKFKPTIVDGAAVRVSGVITYNFVL